MIRPLLLLTAALLAAAEAAALSCAMPDPVQSFRMAQESPERYVVLHGRLTFDESLMPGGFTEQPQDGTGVPDMLTDPVPARFEGFALGLDGFTRPLDTAVTLQPSCLGPWCGAMGEGVWLLFAQVTEGGYRVAVEPCGSWTFEAPTEAVLSQMAACMRGEACGT
jgi:hypothetical protein